MPDEELVAALSVAAGRGHLRCARMLVDRLVQAWLDAHQLGRKPTGIHDLDYSLAGSA
jgi:hypothetical protein